MNREDLAEHIQLQDKIMRCEFEAYMEHKFNEKPTRANQAMMFANGRRVAEGDYIMNYHALAWEVWKHISSKFTFVAEVEHPDIYDEQTDVWFSNAHLKALRGLQPKTKLFAVKP